MKEIIIIADENTEKLMEEINTEKKHVCFDLRPIIHIEYKRYYQRHFEISFFKTLFCFDIYSVKNFESVNQLNELSENLDSLLLSSHRNLINIQKRIVNICDRLNISIIQFSKQHLQNYPENNEIEIYFPILNKNGKTVGIISVYTEKNKENKNNPFKIYNTTLLVF